MAELPELPEPDDLISYGAGHVGSFAADQMTAYGLACYRVALEKAAETADARSKRVAASNTYRGKVNSAGSFAVGILEDLAAAIRSLMKEPK